MAIDDLNKASADQLAKLPGVGQERAREIVNYRKEHGPFQSFDDLKQKIPDLGDKLVDTMQNAGDVLKNLGSKLTGG